MLDDFSCGAPEIQTRKDSLDMQNYGSTMKMVLMIKQCIQNDSIIIVIFIYLDF